MHIDPYAHISQGSSAQCGCEITAFSADAFRIWVVTMPRFSSVHCMFTPKTTTAITHEAENWIQSLSEDWYITDRDPFAPERDGVSSQYIYLHGDFVSDPTRIMVYGDPNPWQSGVMTGYADHRVVLLTEDEFARQLEAQQNSSSSEP